MYNLKNTKINFVSAEDGKVFLSYTENGIRKEKGSENPIILADIMKKHGFEDTVMGLHLQWILQKSMDLDPTMVQKNYIKML